MNKKIIIINSINVVFVLLATILMFLGIQFMKSDFVLEVSGISLLKFFTVESNILMGITSLLVILYKSKIPYWLKKLSLISTTAVTLTCVTVIFYLAPISKFGYISLFQNSNLFFHLIVPLLSITSYVINKDLKLKSMKEAYYGLVPTFLYSIFYIINAIMHIENGKVSQEADWYRFFSNGLCAAIITIVIMYIASYLIARVLIYLNLRYGKRKK